MPRGNTKGGKKHKKGKKNTIENNILRIKEDGQEYAQITACKGNCRFDVKCFDGKDRMGTLCGTMRKRVFVNANDIVLVSLRDFQDDKCDIIDVYNETNVLQLKEQKQIPESILNKEDNIYTEGYDSIEFVNDIPIDDDDDDMIDLDEI